MNRKIGISFFAALLVAAVAVLALSVAGSGALAQNANSSMTESAEGQETPGGEQADLSGTYKGRLNMTGGHTMSGEATLTITGGTFTLEGEGMNHSGKVYAVTTRGYTGASFFFTDLTDSGTNTPVVASVRARKTARSLVLSPVPGASTKMSFNGRSQ